MKRIVSQCFRRLNRLSESRAQQLRAFRPICGTNLRNVNQIVKKTKQARKCSSNPTQAVYEEFSEILKRSKFRKCTDTITLDPRVLLPKEEFRRICALHGLSEEESTEYADALHNAGFIYYPKNKRVYNEPIMLKPKQAMEAMERTFQIGQTQFQAYIEQRKKELDELLSEYEPLDKQYKQMLTRGQNFGTWCLRGCFSYVIFQSVGIIWLTWFKLSWDIMEPVTYLIQIFTMTTGVYFFMQTNGDFTWEAFVLAFQKMRMQTLIRKTKFDLQRYRDLQFLIEQCEDDLNNPEWYCLKQINPTLPDPWNSYTQS